MSSSFVKDCSDVSAPRNSSSGKTVIIIVNETGNISLDQDELQNLLASHGADGSQVSVVRMGSGGAVGNVNEIVTNPSIVTAADGTAHVNLSIEGYPTIPLEGTVGSGMNYAELPLDQDAFQRLESVLESEEAREILGEPLLNMVTNPDQLGTFDQLMDSSLFEGSEQDHVNAAENQNNEGSKKSRSPPKRRSQRQMDKAEREEVEKILAENQKLLQEEKQHLNEQVVERMRQLSTGNGKEEEHDDDEEGEEEEEEEEETETDENDGDDDCGKTTAKNKKTVVKKKGRKGKSEESMDKPKGRGRGRGRGKMESEKGSSPEIKGRGKGRKKTEEEESETSVGRGRGKGRGSTKEETIGNVKGRGRGLSKKDERETVIGKKKVVLLSDGKSVSPLSRKKKNEHSEEADDENVVKAHRGVKGDKQGEKEGQGNKKVNKQDVGDKDKVEGPIKNINTRVTDSKGENTKKVKFKNKNENVEHSGSDKRTLKKTNEKENDDEDVMEVDDNDTDAEDEDIVAGFSINSKELHIKSLKVAVDKIKVHQALEKDVASPSHEDGDGVPLLSALGSSDPNKKVTVSVPSTSKLVSEFKPSIFSSPRVNNDGGEEASLSRALIMKGKN